MSYMWYMSIRFRSVNANIICVAVACIVLVDGMVLGYLFILFTLLQVTILFIRYTKLRNIFQLYVRCGTCKASLCDNLSRMLVVYIVHNIASSSYDICLHSQADVLKTDVKQFVYRQLCHV